MTVKNVLELKRRYAAVVATIVIIAAAIGVAYYQMTSSKDLSDTVGDGGVMQFSLMSSEFKDGDVIPTKYTCDGEDASPPLSWDDPPEGTRSLALIMDDPDAPIGVFTLWVLFKLPKDATELPEGLP
ncbi:MAG: YbhB/YbcL family Raf kinase inhibitor-like protein, partial [Nitrososphaerales archaeon]